MIREGMRRRLRIRVKDVIRRRLRIRDKDKG